MRLRKEVLNRLLLAKSILSPAKSAVSGHASAHLVARQVLNAHDAADLTFAAIADQRRKLSAKGKAPSMIECLELIGDPGKKYAGYFKQLNDARNSLKHVGNLPNTQQWAGVGADVFAKLSSLCSATLRVSLEDVDESELLENADVKAHLSAARKHGFALEFKEALEQVAWALRAALEGADLWDIAVGKVNAEDALKLTAFGVPANDFLRLQEFLPVVEMFFPTPARAGWAQAKFGHPGNWRQDAFDFCVDTCLVVALGIQSASQVPAAVDFDILYNYRITALRDHVEVWEDLIDEQAEERYGDTRIFRSPKRYLEKGESIDVSATVRPFVSDDLLPSGEWIKRVRVSGVDFSGLLPMVSAEFVNLADVKIACVPRALGLFEGRFDDLTEMPWEPDQETRSFLESRIPPADSGKPASDAPAGDDAGSDSPTT